MASIARYNNSVSVCVACLAVGSIAFLHFSQIAQAENANAACSAVGDVCPDGSIFVGASPGDGRPMYLAASDGEGYDTSMGSTWGPTDYSAPIPLCEDEKATGESCANGKSNVGLFLDLNAKLRENNGGYDEYQAAMHCEQLIAHDHDDWYLPARDELYAVFKIAGLAERADMIGSYFWTSSLMSPAHRWAVHFDEAAGDILSAYAAGDMRVRCVRTD